MKLLSLLPSLAALVGNVWAASRTSPPSGSVVVAKSGGQYTSLQAAINSISTSSTATTTIFIQPGTYSGQVSIPSLKGKLIVYAYTTNDQDYTKNQVTLTNTLSAADAGSNDLSATLRVATNYFSLYNVNLVNGYGKGSQALAVSANGQYQAYYGCSFVGYQDTIYTNKPHQVYKNSYIEGATDFIFGNDGNAWFEKCTIAINELSDVVKPVGWSAWGTNPTANVYYAEYGNTGTGASGTRVSWAKKLSSAVSIDSILPGWTSWVDTTYWNSS
ncbi:pectinesterase [Colletotrichum tofieldiae]|nr:pectinesterase [Colletotrichum tofieldiae]